MPEAVPVISEEVPATPPKTRALKWTVSTIAIAMSLFHMYVAAFGPPEAFVFRGTHLLFTLTLVFLLYPLRPGGAIGWRVFDMVLLLASWGFILHIFLNYEYVTYRTIYIDDLTPADTAYAVIALLIVLEATRRVLGWALPITAAAFLAYAVFLTNVKIPVLLEQMYLSLEGIFGPTLGVSASYVMLFVLFGAFMERSGTGRLFMEFALAITGHTAGGPGKVSVVSSALFGTVSGSAVANVMVDGPITIPLMKKTGFHPPFASAVEAVASTGGQIMPPVMGAAAFVMAEFLAVSYFQVTIWAAIPAILYYVAVFFSVHFRAKRTGILGVPKSELPPLGTVMRERGHLFIPIVIVFVTMVAGYSAPFCALCGTLGCIPIALLKKITRREITWHSVVDALEDGAKNTLLVAMACACAGIVVGSVTLTGLGISFTQVVVGMARDMLPLALLLTAIAGIVLGMGMPTTPAYIVMVSLLVPAVIKLGAIAPAAHMFAFYFAILSAITPPVALAVYAAASLGKTDLWKSGWEAVRIGAAGFIVPFMFVYEPSLLIVGDWQDIVSSFITATIGTILLAASLQGYLIKSATMWQRVILFVAALCLIKPGWKSDLVGLALWAFVFAWQFYVKKKRTVNEAAP